MSLRFKGDSDYSSMDRDTKKAGHGKQGGIILL